MTKKNQESPDDLRGFEEFIEGQQSDSSFMGKPHGANGTKKETSFEHFTFLTTDAQRLVKIKNLLATKLPFAAKFEQAGPMIKLQTEELNTIKKQIFDLVDKKDSSYRRSLGDVFDSYFSPPND